MAGGGIPVQYLIPERYVETKVCRCADHPDARASLFEIAFRVACPVCGKPMERISKWIDAWTLTLEPGWTGDPHPPKGAVSIKGS